MQENEAFIVFLSSTYEIMRIKRVHTFH